MHANPAAEGRRVAANIHRDVEHFTLDNPHQLSLGLLQLVVQAAQDAALRA
ncbi:hypothetical protein D9M70_641850 [compost metagenome]